MKSLKLAFILFFIGFSLHSQKSQSNSIANKNSYITASLWPIVDPYAPRMRFGYVQHITTHWKAGLDIGYGTKGLSSIFSYGNNTGVEYTLWEVRPEVYYIFNPEVKTLKYLSVELFYIDQDHVFENDDYNSETNGKTSYDRADFTRQKYGMHFKFGLFLDMGKHLGFNFFGGIGFRFADKEYSNVINPQEDNIYNSWFAGPYEREGKVFGFNPSLGIKIYYKI
ncbi:MAG: hypothetical protein AB8B59_09285 [Maribacter sp.]